MTANQIAYAKVREDQRHNVVTEGETGRHNLVTERQKDRDIAIGESTALSQRMQAETARDKQQEEVRHNFEQEGINWWSATHGLSETQRHNQALEGVETFKAQSLAGLQSAQGEATLRQAAASETQAQASLRSASAAQTSAGAAYQSALAASLNAETRQKEQSESVRHNVASERIGTTQAAASEKQASAATRQATTAAKRQSVDAAVSQKNATSQRISSVASAVNAGANVLDKVSGLAKSIIGR